MKRVTGIGGIVFKAKDAPALQAWYKRHLGIDVQEWGGTAFPWTDGEGKPVAGTTVWSIGSAQGAPFAPSTSLLTRQHGLNIVEHASRSVEATGMRRNLVILAATICLATAASSASAHHSHPYFYDQCKSVTIEGRVESVQFKDPHTIIMLRLDDGTAYTVDWAGLRGLTNNGILGPAKEALVFGARIVVTGNPIRDVTQIREHFSDIKSVNPSTVDPRSIRGVGDDFSWALSPSPNPPNCDRQ